MPAPVNRIPALGAGQGAAPNQQSLAQYMQAQGMPLDNFGAMTLLASTMAPGSSNYGNVTDAFKNLGPPVRQDPNNPGGFSPSPPKIAPRVQPPPQGVAPPPPVNRTAIPQGMAAPPGAPQQGQQQVHPQQQQQQQQAMIRQLMQNPQFIQMLMQMFRGGGSGGGMRGLGAMPGGGGTGPVM